MQFAVRVHEDGDIEIKGQPASSFTIHLVLPEDELVEELEQYGAGQEEVLTAIERAKISDQWVSVN